MRITIAIFAALVLPCFSKPISSSVGARHVFAAEAHEKTYTAADYVQDGLIAHWDGIENVGYGLHDDNPTYWVDLTGGGADWILEDQYTGRPFDCGVDYVEIVGGVMWPRDRAGHCIPSWESADEILTVELVIDISSCDMSTTVNKQIVTFGGGTSGLGNGSWLQTLFLSENYLCCKGGNYPKVPLDFLVSSISLEFGRSEVLLNGKIEETLKATQSNYSYCGPVISAYSGTAATGAKIKCLRIYRRQLSLQEKEWNYSIDKARFRL